MQIQSVHTILSKSDLSVSQSALSSFSSGEIIQAEVTEADQGQVILRLPQGNLLKASQQATESLQTGDVVLLQVSKEEDQSTCRLELISVNGQPLKAGAPIEEYVLLRIQVPPSAANRSIAASLAEMGAPVRPETFARMAELSSRFPSLEADAALLFAASSLPLNADSVAAFSSWLQCPVKTADLAAAAEVLTNQESPASATEALASQESPAAAALEATDRPMPEAAPSGSPQLSAFALPDGLSPGLAAKLAQSCIWQELCEHFLTLPNEEAPEFILELMSALPSETTGAERNLLYQTLCNGYAQTPEIPSTPSQVTEQAVAFRPEDTLADNPQSFLPSEPASEHAQASSQNFVLKDTLRGLFAALFEPGEPGLSLRDAATGLETKLRAFASALQIQVGPEAARLKPVLELSQTLTTQVQMGGELGNVLYIPLPITLHENRQDVGLYVLKRDGGSGKVDESNVTVAICLETQYLGPVDALLQVQHNEIALQFR